MLTMNYQDWLYERNLKPSKSNWRVYANLAWKWRGPFADAQWDLVAGVRDGQLHDNAIDLIHALLKAA